MNKLGIICAFHFEARCFTSGTLPARQPVEINDQTLLIMSGMGAERARQAGQQLVEADVDCLVSFGAAGALAPAPGPGDLVAPRQVYEAGNHYAVSAALPAAVQECLSRHNVNIHTDPLACVSEPLGSAAAKQALFRQTGAVAVDMESAAVLEVAQRHGLAACVLRVIIDAAHVTVPVAALRRVDEFGRTDIPGLAGDLLRSPAQIAPVLRLACASRRAGRTLTLVAQELVAQELVKTHELVYK